MNPLNDPKELIRRFNEREAVWRRYEEKRLERRLFGLRIPLSEEILDDLDWLEAERECRTVRAIGFYAPPPP